MGIQGLLPLLKPIQRLRHLSEFAGQTLAVDAYVWLHRGAYACATELVLGKPTRRYVDYCMARVRLLRHHGITPYLVFDGGPLPAKLGTEKDREKKREQFKKHAEELMAQGKAGQAREMFVKCVDVTPQMAYQVIKALKTEGIPYVVAPYEADAQLAYLERVGLVDGIITEDSDLLVFGCRNVLVKLDTVAATLISISRTDFGSASLAAESFSLIGWSDAQFRWMAMLSGCDYLPSIAGIGLKTAYQLLKKHKNVEKVVKMIRLEGKKSVPRDYLDAFHRAEKVFLHQRVFDPRLKELVYLARPSADFRLNGEVEMYIGRHIEPVLATSIAEGDACPISHAPMHDINPTFTPKLFKVPALRTRNMNSSTPSKGKESSGKKDGIFNFFSPLSRAPNAGSYAPHSEHLDNNSGKIRSRARIVAGNASGKRTLVDVMEQDFTTKRKKISMELEMTRNGMEPSKSHFFTRTVPSPSPSVAHVAEKENVGYASSTAVRDIIDDPVSQEDGYLSPTPSLPRDGTPELSSPVISYGRRTRDSADMESKSSAMSRSEAVGRVFVRGSSEPPMECAVNLVPGPDLAANLAIEDDDDLEVEGSSEILCWEDDCADQREYSKPSPERTLAPCLSAKTVQTVRNARASLTRVASFDDPTGELELLEIDEHEEEIREEEQKAVQSRLAQKWRLTYSLGSRLRDAQSSIDLQFSTKAVHHKALDCDVVSAVQGPSKRPGQIRKQAREIPARRGLGGRGLSTPSGPVRHDSRASTVVRPGTGARGAPVLIDVDGSDEITCSSKAKLQVFRFSV